MDLVESTNFKTKKNSCEEGKVARSLRLENYGQHFTSRFFTFQDFFYFFEFFCFNFFLRNFTSQLCGIFLLFAVLRFSIFLNFFRFLCIFTTKNFSTIFNSSNFHGNFAGKICPPQLTLSGQAAASISRLTVPLSSSSPGLAAGSDRHRVGG